MPDESDEILIRIQEWKFVRNFLTACQNGHFNQTCFSALNSWPASSGGQSTLASRVSIIKLAFW